MLKYILFFPLAFLLSTQQCAINKNYTEPNQPAFTATYADSQTVVDDTLLVVSYNIKYSRKIKQALYNLQKWPELENADFVLLQEVNATAADTIAQVLQYNYIYFPATVHIIAGHDFGNAVLSKYPIVQQEKFILPYTNPWNKAIRIVTIANILVNDDTLTVASLHAETSLMQAEKKREQIQAISEYLQSHYDKVICGGDFNCALDKNIVDMNAAMQQQQFTNGTENIGITAKTGIFNSIPLSLDRIFVYNLTPLSSGKILDFSASDHAPVWVKVSLKR